MTHIDLINEATRQLASRFQPNPLDIKRRIEGLIEVRCYSPIILQVSVTLFIARIPGAM